MSIPIILGAGLLKISNLHAHDINGPFFIGVLVAAITGYFSIRWLLNYLNKGSYVIFAWYRFIFAVIVIIIVLNRS
jgi:undecaprenyl-diphosphatase